MLLNNFKAFFVKNTGAASNNLYFTSITGASITMNAANNAQGYNCFKSICGWWNGYSYTSDYGRLDVGFDDTPVSASDYSFSGNYEQNLLTATAIGNNEKTTGEIWNLFINLRNDGGSNVTVREIAYLVNPGTTSGQDKYFMIMRKVLDTPVTIAPGETYSFNYVLKFKN